MACIFLGFEASQVPTDGSMENLRRHSLRSKMHELHTRIPRMIVVVIKNRNSSNDENSSDNNSNAKKQEEEEGEE